MTGSNDAIRKKRTLRVCGEKIQFFLELLLRSRFSVIIRSVYMNLTLLMLLPSFLAPVW